MYLERFVKIKNNYYLAKDKDHFPPEGFKNWIKIHQLFI